ncbi:MAG: ABC transporter permease subunit [Deltaproteobacteria bacterium]|nr:ABC transporter permease subunit [Deltaproteobacteria bacterium]
MSTSAVWAIAHKELTDKLKSRWIVIIGAGFALFTVVISYFGGVASGAAGFRELDATVASLTSLVTYFIPILALTMGGGMMADEKERGTLDIFLSSPISVAEFMAGTFVGLVLALVISTVAGLGLAGTILVVRGGTDALVTFSIFIVNSIVMGVVFLSISFLISVLLYERARVIAVTIFIWLFFTILYDLGLVGLLISTKGDVGPELFSALLLFNPVDVYRIMNFVSIGEFRVLIGLTSVEFPGFMGAALLWSVSLAWVALPMMGSYFIFKKKYME